MAFGDDGRTADRQFGDDRAGVGVRLQRREHGAAAGNGIAGERLTDFDGEDDATSDEARRTMSLRISCRPLLDADELDAPIARAAFERVVRVLRPGFAVPGGRQPCRVDLVALHEGVLDGGRAASG